MNTSHHDSNSANQLQPAGGSIVWLAQPASVLVFTDLDGTLLDDTYDIAAAAAAMDELSRKGVMTIAVSSKTLREMRSLDALRERPAPFIFENGAGIAWPDAMIDDEVGERIHHHLGDHGIELIGRPYGSLCQALDRLRSEKRYDFRGFNDMDTTEITALTGLDDAGAANARERLCSEPILWHDSEARLDAFRSDLAAMQLRLIAGGRFLHVLPDTDKAEAMASVTSVYQGLSAERIPVLACGDSPNDLAMLKAADACLTFPRTDGSHLNTGRAARLHAKAPGTQAWREGVAQLLTNVVPCITGVVTNFQEPSANE